VRKELRLRKEMGPLGARKKINKIITRLRIFNTYYFNRIKRNIDQERSINKGLNIFYQVNKVG